MTEEPKEPERAEGGDGWLPVCASCKRVEVVMGDWLAAEIYLLDHLRLSVIHGLCARCAHRLHPDAGIPAGQALRHVEGALPVCSSCKAVRQGDEWTPLAAFLRGRVSPRVIHGLCQACLADL